MPFKVLGHEHPAEVFHKQLQPRIMLLALLLIFDFSHIFICRRGRFSSIGGGLKSMADESRVGFILVAALVDRIPNLFVVLRSPSCLRSDKAASWQVRKLRSIEAHHYSVAGATRVLGP